MIRWVLMILGCMAIGRVVSESSGVVSQGKDL